MCSSGGGVKLLYGVSDISDRTQQPKSANLVFAHSVRNKVITIDSIVLTQNQRRLIVSRSPRNTTTTQDMHIAHRNKDR